MIKVKHYDVRGGSIGLVSTLLDLTQTETINHRVRSSVGCVVHKLMHRRTTAGFGQFCVR
eukprot:6181990-Pleurochrysis_carterae.AAC.2